MSMNILLKLFSEEFQLIVAYMHIFNIKKLSAPSVLTNFYARLDKE